MLTVESPAEYLALDAHQTVGKQLTASQFQLCTKSSEILHCPHLNLLTKGLKRLCLYNLFVQNPDDVEETCEVKVSQLKTHAVQVGASTYRLLTAEPTQLVTECEDGINNTLVDGAHMVELSDRCPRASTAEFVFARTPSLYQRHRLVNIPLVVQTTKWLDDMSRELTAVAVRRQVQWYLNGTKTLALPNLRKALEDRHFDLYRNIYSYGQMVLMGIVTPTSVTRASRPSCVGVRGGAIPRLGGGSSHRRQH